MALPWLPGHLRGERGCLCAFLLTAMGRVVWQKRVNPKMPAECRHLPGFAMCQSGGAVLCWAAGPCMDGALTWQSLLYPVLSLWDIVCK